MDGDSIREIPSLVQELYRVVGRLETLFPGRRFTLDGHLVGSIGEVVAAHDYGLELLPTSAPGHDARAVDGRLVQIKATQRNGVALRSEPDMLLVLKLLPDGSHKEVYSGPGALPWASAGRMQKNGTRPIGLSKLRDLMANVSEDQKLLRAGT